MTRKQFIRTILLAVISLTYCLSTGHTQNDLEYKGSAMWSSVNDILLYQNYLYCGMVNGLRVIDVSNPSAPITVKEIFLNEDVRALDIEGTTLYLGSLNGGLLSFDISNPLSPVLLDVLHNLPGRLLDLDAESSLVVLASETAVNFVDASTPSQLALLKSLAYIPNDGFYDNGVIVQDTIAYVAAAQLLIFNVADPSNPQEIARLQTHANAWNLFLQDSILLIADETVTLPSGIPWFTTVNVSDPANPFVIGGYRSSGNIVNVVGKDERAFLSAGGSGIIEYDMSDLTTPVPISCHRYSGWTAGAQLRDNYLYVNHLNCTWKSDVVINTHICSDSNSVNGQYPVGAGGLEILDITLPGSPISLSATRNFDHPMDIQTNPDGLITVCDEESGVSILSMDHGDTLEFIKSFDVMGFPQQASTCNGVVAVGTMFGSLQIFDLSDSSNSLPIASLTGYGRIEDVVTYGTFIYATTNTGLRIIDLSNPSIPLDITPLSFQYSAANLFISGNRLFVSNLSNTVRVFELSNPALPALIDTISVPNGGNISHLAISEDLLFTENPNAIAITNITDLEHPAFITTFSHGEAFDITAQNGFVVLANSLTGISVFDVATPDQPILAASFDTPGAGLSVSMKGNNILLADWHSVLQFALPMRTGVGTGNGELPQSPFTLKAYPNPFNPSTQIDFSLPRKCHVTITAHNVLGQLIDTIVDEEFSAGEHLVTWNTATRQKTLSSGIYFLNLDTNIGLGGNTKVTLLR